MWLFRSYAQGGPHIYRYLVEAVESKHLRVAGIKAVGSGTAADGSKKS